MVHLYKFGMNNLKISKKIKYPEMDSTKNPYQSLVYSLSNVQQIKRPYLQQYLHPNIHTEQMGK